MPYWYCTMRRLIHPVHLEFLQHVFRHLGASETQLAHIIADTPCFLAID